MVHQTRSCDRRALRGVPALQFEVTRQRVGLELRAHAFRHAHPPGHHAVAKEAGPGVEQYQDRAVLQRQYILVPGRRHGIGRQLEPIEAVRRQRQQVRQIADRRERNAAEHLDRYASLEGRQIKLYRLCRLREVEHRQDHVVAVLAQIGQDLAVAGLQEGASATTESAAGLAGGQHALGPVEQRAGVARLRLDIEGLVTVHRVHDRL